MQAKFRIHGGKTKVWNRAGEQPHFFAVLERITAPELWVGQSWVMLNFITEHLQCLLDARFAIHSVVVPQLRVNQTRAVCPAVVELHEQLAV